MRTSDALMIGLIVALAAGLSPAVSFDGMRIPEGGTIAVPLPNVGPNPEGDFPPLRIYRGPEGEFAEPFDPRTIPLRPVMRLTPLAPVPVAPLTVPPTPQDSFRSGTRLLRQGKIDPAVMDLEFAAEQGVPGAIWKLGRMYADGDGVKQNEARAYEYFRRLTTVHAADSAGTPNARFLANAFVTLGLYYQDGIPGTLKADPNHAREMFQFAASYFADPEAQYYLAKLYFAGKGAPKDAMTAARWLQSSAEKGDHRAQALLGSMLFKRGRQRAASPG